MGPFWVQCQHVTYGLTSSRRPSELAWYRVVLTKSLVNIPTTSNSLVSTWPHLLTRGQLSNTTVNASSDVEINNAFLYPPLPQLSVSLELAQQHYRGGLPGQLRYFSPTMRSLYPIQVLMCRPCWVNCSEAVKRQEGSLTDFTQTPAKSGTMNACGVSTWQ